MLGELEIDALPRVASLNNSDLPAFLDFAKVEGEVTGLVPGTDYFLHIEASSDTAIRSNQSWIFGMVGTPEGASDALVVVNGNWAALAPLIGASDGYLHAEIIGTATNPEVHTLTLTQNDHGTVTASPEGPYTPGTEVTLTATPNEGYEFSKWLIGEDEFTDNPLTFTIEADTMVTPEFRSVGAILYDTIPDQLPNFRDGIDAGPPGIAELQPLSAQPFLTGEHGSIASVSVPMLNDNGGGSVDMVLAENDNGRPGQTIATLGTIDLQTLPEWRENDAIGTIITFNTVVTGLHPNSRYFIGFDQANQVDPEGNQQKTFYNLYQKDPEGTNGSSVVLVGPFGEWKPLSEFRPDANYMMMRVVEGPAPPTDPFIIASSDEGDVTADPNLDEYPIGSEVTVTATPRGGFEFVKWLYGDEEFTTNPATITVTSGAKLTPVFAPVEPEPEPKPIVIDILPAMAIRWNSQSGRTYEVQSSSDLQNWTSEATNVEGTDDILTHFFIRDAREMYYRVLENR